MGPWRRQPRQQPIVDLVRVGGAILWDLGEQVEDEQLQRLRDIVSQTAEWLRRDLHMVVHQRKLVAAAEDVPAGEQFVQHTTEGEKRAEIREAMDKCRPAVRVWIMPIYRIAEQLTVGPNIFDVVIVDEASQAGPEAVFLQYLAPKVVVIGDDKQVSPSAAALTSSSCETWRGSTLPTIATGRSGRILKPASSTSRRCDSPA